MTRAILLVGAQTIQYTGAGYQYFYTTDAIKGAHAKLQIPKGMLATFEARVGKCNSTGLPHLELLDQGAGWVLVTSDTIEHDGVVVQFLSRLNRWVLKTTTEPLPVRPKSTHYTIQTRNFVHPGQIRVKEQAKQEAPQTPDLTKLQQLEQTINGRYGHVR